MPRKLETDPELLLLSTTGNHMRTAGIYRKKGEEKQNTEDSGQTVSVLGTEFSILLY